MVFLRDVYGDELGRNNINTVIISTVLLTTSFVTSEAYDHAWFRSFKRRVRNLTV